MQAGHRIGISRLSGNESKKIFSVVSPVGTLLPTIGQRIIILGIGVTEIPAELIRADLP
jgi:hypothetical protein